jgi:hypothetical protein
LIIYLIQIYFEESISFLQRPNCISFSKHINQAISFVSQNINQLDFSIPQTFSTPVLEKLFSSEHLKIQNETSFFVTVQSLIDLKQKNRILLSQIHFQFVENNILKSFLKNLRLRILIIIYLRN